MKLSRRSTFKGIFGAAAAVVAGQIGGAEAKETAPESDDVKIAAAMDYIRQSPEYLEFVKRQTLEKLGASPLPPPSVAYEGRYSATLGANDSPKLKQLKQLIRPWYVEFPAHRDNTEGSAVRSFGDHSALLEALDNHAHAPGGTGIGPTFEYVGAPPWADVLLDGKPFVLKPSDPTKNWGPVRPKDVNVLARWTDKA